MCERIGAPGVKVRRSSEEAPQSRGCPGAQQSTEGRGKSPGKGTVRTVPPLPPAFNYLIAQIIMFTAENQKMQRSKATKKAIPNPRHAEITLLIWLC